MFSPEEIQAIAQKSLETDVTVPDGHKGALVTVVNKDKIEIVSAFKMNEHWVTQLVATHNWVGTNDVGLVSKLTW